MAISQRVRYEFLYLLKQKEIRTLFFHTTGSTFENTIRHSHKHFVVVQISNRPELWFCILAFSILRFVLIYALLWYLSSRTRITRIVDKHTVSEKVLIEVLILVVCDFAVKCT